MRFVACTCIVPCTASHVILETLEEAALVWPADSHMLWALQQPCNKTLPLEIPIDRVPHFRPRGPVEPTRPSGSLPYCVLCGTTHIAPTGQVSAAHPAPPSAGPSTNTARGAGPC